MANTPECEFCKVSPSKLWPQGLSSCSSLCSPCSLCDPLQSFRLLPLGPLHVSDE